MSVQIAVFSLIYLTLTAYALQCVKENGDSVDWGIIYKLPQVKDSKNDIIKLGLGYVHMTADEPFWTLSKFKIDDDDSLLAKHMKMYLDHQAEISFLAYNDILPAPLHGKESKTAGQAKGLILADADGGIWTTGTLTGYPGPAKKYTYPDSGKPHGEFFSCISLDLKTLDKVGSALRYREAQIFASHITPVLEQSLPELSSISKAGKPNSSPWNQVEKLKSRAGNNLISFSKSKEFTGDLYGDLIVSNLKTDILVRSSLTKMDRLPSNCTGSKKVKNIKTITIEAAGVTIKNEEDNSKWAISESITDSESWICLGDMDRNESGQHRGGGATCLSNKDATMAFKKAVSSVEEC